MITQRSLLPEMIKCMTPTKIEAFFKEFPAIRNFITGALRQVFVQKIEPDFLNYSICYKDRLDFPVDNHIWEELTFLDEHFNRVDAELRYERKKYLGGLFGPRVTKVKRISGKMKPDKTIMEWARIAGEKADLVRFIVSYHPDTKTVILYKIPDRLSLGDWIRAELEKETKELQKAWNE